MQELDILIEDQRWAACDIEGMANRSVSATLCHLQLDPETCSLSLLACDDRRIAALNADFRGKPTPTNVLSWPEEELSAMTPGGQPVVPEPDFDGLLCLGDIALSYDTCLAEAQASGKPLHDHITHLLVHGTLHLLGYDHTNEPDAALMEGLETKILGKLGLDDPYTEE